MERREYIEQPEQKKFTDSIMTAEQYAELEDHDEPYRYELKAGDKELVYLGVAHSANPEAESFKTIKQDIETIHPDLVMIEGRSGINGIPQEKLKEVADNYSSNNDAIKRHGESAFTAKVAIENGIRVNSPEPPDSEKIKYILEQGISKEAVFAEAIVTLLHQYHWLEEKPALEEYLEQYRASFENETKWEGFDLSFDHYKELHKKFTGKEFDINDKETIERLNDPIPWEGRKYTEVNKVAALSSEFRDRYMVEQIQKEFEKVDKIYVVFGASHAVMQEPALRKLMDSYGK